MHEVIERLVVRGEVVHDERHRARPDGQTLRTGSEALRSALADPRATALIRGIVRFMLGDVDKPIGASAWRHRHKRALDAYRAECDRRVTEHPELKPLLAAAEERAYARSPKQSPKGSA